MRLNKKAGIVALVALATCAALAAGCSAPQSATQAAPAQAAAGKATAADIHAASLAAAGATVVQEGTAEQPEIVQYADGTFVQRTPDEDVSMAPYHQPTKWVSGSLAFENNDTRGCGYCHDDLGKTLDGMAYGHHELANDLGLQVNVLTCTQCHRVGGSTVQSVDGELGSIIHGIHADVDTTCWNCHDASNGGSSVADGQDSFYYYEAPEGADYASTTITNGMYLWDLTKHNKLRGISDIAADDIDVDFSYANDELQDANTLFNVKWAYFDWDYERIAHIENGDPTDDEIFDNWEITVSGAVDQEMTWTLPEMIEQFESKTFIGKLNCTVNPTNGALAGQAEWTGIRVADLLSAAGLTADAANVTILDPTGGYSASDSVEGLLDEANDCYIVYLMNGEHLPWSQGFPAMYVNTHVAAFNDVKEVSELVVSAGEGGGFGAGVRFGLEFVKPSVGIYDLREGQIVQTGRTHTFKGYVDAYNEEVVALELSMDRGKSWKTLEVNSPEIAQLITWTIDWTPETDGAYCIAVRGVTASGVKTAEYVEKMVVAKTEMPQAAQ